MFGTALVLLRGNPVRYLEEAACQYLSLWAHAPFALWDGAPLAKALESTPLQEIVFRKSRFPALYSEGPSALTPTPARRAMGWMSRLAGSVMLGLMIFYNFRLLVALIRRTPLAPAAWAACLAAVMVQACAILVCMVEGGLLRYLMGVYPLLLLAGICALYEISNRNKNFSLHRCGSNAG